MTARSIKYNREIHGPFFGTSKGAYSMGSGSGDENTLPSASNGSTQASPAEPGSELENWLLQKVRPQIAREQSSTDEQPRTPPKP